MKAAYLIRLVLDHVRIAETLDSSRLKNVSDIFLFFTIFQEICMAFMTSALFSNCKFLNSNKRKVNSWKTGLDYFILRLGDENEI